MSVPISARFVAKARKHIIEPLYYSRRSSPFLPNWRQVEMSQHLDLEALRDLQSRRLRHLLSTLTQRNAFYRDFYAERGANPGTVEGIDELRALPLLEKDAIRAAGDAILSNGFHKAKLLVTKTGGSTGVSLELYKTWACNERKRAMARRFDRWSGWEVGEGVGAVWGNPPPTGGLRERLYHWSLHPWIYLDTMALDDASIHRFARQWAKAHPTMLYGHSHSLYLLSRFVRELGIDAIRPTSIISTSMMLLEHERSHIEQTFGVKVTDRYGCEEVSLIGCECEAHDGYHLNIEHLVVEFLGPDGNPVAPGEEGEIVVTDLLNEAMPLIRYRVGDVGVPSPRACKCRCALPMMDRVVGRVADFLLREDGARVAGVSLIERTLSAIPGIKQMQLVQDEINCLLVNLVTDEGFGHQTLDRLDEELRLAMGQQCRIEHHLVEAIPQVRSGKYRFSICNIA